MLNDVYKQIADALRNDVAITQDIIWGDAHCFDEVPKMERIKLWSFCKTDGYRELAKLNNDGIPLEDEISRFDWEGPQNYKTTKLTESYNATPGAGKP